MDKYSIKNHNIFPAFEISSELFPIFVCKCMVYLELTTIMF